MPCQLVKRAVYAALFIWTPCKALSFTEVVSCFPPRQTNQSLSNHFQGRAACNSSTDITRSGSLNSVFFLFFFYHPTESRSLRIRYLWPPRITAPHWRIASQDDGVSWNKGMRNTHNCAGEHVHQSSIDVDWKFKEEYQNTNGSGGADRRGLSLSGAKKRCGTKEKDGFYYSMEAWTSTFKCRNMNHRWSLANR